MMEAFLCPRYACSKLLFPHATPYPVCSLLCVSFLDMKFAGYSRRSLWSAVVSMSIQKLFGDRILHFVLEVSELAQ
jgi:hypothetical protein